MEGSGDDKAVAEAKDWLPRVIICETKKGTGWQSADLVPPEKSRAMVREATAAAAEKRERAFPSRAENKVENVEGVPRQERAALLHSPRPRRYLLGVVPRSPALPPVSTRSSLAKSFTPGVSLRIRATSSFWAALFTSPVTVTTPLLT